MEESKYREIKSKLFDAKKKGETFGMALSSKDSNKSSNLSVSICSIEELINEKVSKLTVKGETREGTTIKMVLRC